MAGRLTLAVLLLVLAVPASAGEARLAAVITDARLDEISGMAASRRHAGLFWVHNDSDDAPRLYAVDQEGAVRAALSLEGAGNRDWEDMAAFERDGRAFLLIADTGDNGGIREQLTLIALEEPAALGPALQARPAWQLRFRWPDGPRDCEAVAVDAAGGFVYLVAKKRVPPEVWRVPLDGTTDAVVAAERVATLSGVVQPTAEDLARNPVYGRYRSQITAADISADGRRFAALNYRTAYVYERGEGEDWATALARPPSELTLPWLPQAEALALDLDGGSAWISSEKLPAPLLQLPIP
jgi:hypothetical protein